MKLPLFCAYLEGFTFAANQTLTVPLFLILPSQLIRMLHESQLYLQAKIPEYRQEDRKQLADVF